MGKAKDLVGMKFGKLTVLYRAENHTSKNGNSRIAWHCRCECGNEVDVLGLNLTRNHSKSCGCLHKDENDRRRRNLLGEKFGKLTVISFVEGSSPPKWHCRCECGNEKDVLGNNLTTNKTKSCGRCKGGTTNTRGRIGNTTDLTGKRFDKLLAIMRLDDDPITIKYLCKCDCGNECIKPHRSLVYGTQNNGSNSCGCLGKNRGKKADFIGVRFTHCTVIKRVENRYNKVHWLCKCDCGKEFVASSSGLSTGHTKSCGCYKDTVASILHIDDLTGKRYGFLTVLSRAENSQTGYVRWLCKCDCGNETIVHASALKDALTLSCGCFKYSKYELWVDNSLSEMNIKHIPQKRFDDLVGTRFGKLSYDFAIYDKNDELKYLVECQGQQHYVAIDYFGGEEQLVRQQEHDRLKREYAENVLGVEIIEIPYTMDEKEIKEFLKNKLSNFK